VTLSAPTDALDAALRVAEALEAAEVPYALGGALAYGLWGVPRATLDVDLNVFVEPEALAPVFEAFATLGIPVDPAVAQDSVQREGMFQAWYGIFRLDVFTPSIDFAWEAARTRVRRAFDGQEAWFLSAEALAVFKLLFFRPKDLVDLERLVAVQGAQLDVAYVRRQMVAMMGEEDPRVQRWDELSSGFMP
jgi:hypothetical protein